MQIKILDSIECEVQKADGELLLPCLSFKSSYWVQGPHRKQRKEYQKNVFSFKGQKFWRFYTGLLPRVKKWCKENDIKVNIVGEEIKIEPQNKPHLEGPGFENFREDQTQMIDIAIKTGRGTLVAPTQTGKSIIFIGIISCFPDLNILVLSHKTDIIEQNYNRLLKFGFTDVEKFGGDQKIQEPSKRITVSTIQSFSKLDPKLYMDYYDMVFVDEQHRVSKMKSQYAKVLSKLIAPLRFGLTATTKDKKEDDPEAKLTFEGLLGPVIARLSIEKATELKVLKVPKLKIINAEMPSGIGSIYKYQDTYEKTKKHEIECHFMDGNKELWTIESKTKESAFAIIRKELQDETKEYKLLYKKFTNINGERLEKGAYSAGIVENKARNIQVSELVKEKLKDNKIIFIFVVYTKHGELLQEEIRKSTGLNIPFVQGSTPSKERKKIKDGLKNKKIKVCIASDSWSEGLTIKTISDLILASGRKAELQLLQKVGRVLANNNVTITDFNDSKNKHLSLHTTERFSVYINKGWM